ncbi:non-ribosomal peptide synthetase [Rhodococcus spelaei]|uniref:Non-ribosomal peptide synthetase n=1 Tax=Rhodococcus spelaei TaxID=2546320 RepID=A0A541B102_9NOCA|nr:non-ribosomal peptide synthetase [Rhodococcus spelaei]TQF65972.1 non-ribosomal peptide synthetase [Rhodococcus spelaei]
MTSAFPVFTRPVSPTERLYLAMQTLAPPFAIQLLVEGVGAIAELDLAVAVAGAAQACPGARLVRRGDDWVDSGVAPPVHVISDAGLSGDSLDDHPLLTRPLDPVDGPTCEVLLLPGSPNTVVFRAFHGVMDGKGVHLWATEVFRLLRGERPVGAREAVADHTLVERLGGGGKPTVMIPRSRSPLGRTKSVSGEPEFLWRRRTVGSTSPAAVARIAEVITAAVGGRTRIMVPVDLRRHDRDLRSTANLSLPLFLDSVPGDGWQRIHAGLLRGMVESRELAEMNNGGLQRMPTAAARAIIRAGMFLGARTGNNLVSAIVSHTGTTDLGELSCRGFAATRVSGLPVHTGMVPLTIAVMEAGGSTELGVSCRNGAGVEPRLDWLLDRIEAALGATRVVAAPVDPQADRTLTGLFRDHVRSAPEAPAVLGPEGELSYAALDAWSDAIAGELRGRGVRRGDVVAILARRTFAAVAGQIGILKSGAAFLALDPHHPDERIRGIVDEAGVGCVLTEREFAARAGLGAVAAAVLEDIPVRTGDGEGAGTDLAEPGDVAYVTYTSGSTGRPKGVQVEHRGIVNLLRAGAELYRLGPETRFAYYHTQAADMACAALLLPLTSGGAVVLVPGEVNHLTLTEIFEGSTVNTVMVTPSLLEVVVRLGLEPAAMRAVSIGGEALHEPLAAEARALFGPECRVLNSYGPAEMSIVCAAHRIEAVDGSGAAPVPIGRPTAGTTVHVLDAARRPVLAGEIGELYFGGPQVGRGYLNRPDLTAQRFVTLPDGERVYRTGDLGRILPGGELEFSGRVDSQVKIRGNRVEPGEVQSRLAAHPAVARAAVVAVRRAERGDNVLVAYLVASAGESVPEVSTLRDHLSRSLPTYMIPAEFHVVADIPLTSNGKLDSASLGTARADTPTAVLPADDIAEIWACVLRVDASTLDDAADFFELGGDSLAAVEMLSQVSRRVVGPGNDVGFVADLEDLVHRLTLGRVRQAAHRARVPAHR